MNASDIFKNHTGYTYDDLILMPGFISNESSQINLETRVTKNYKIKIPIVSSPMDTVTETQMAIRLALLGGLGIIHTNMSIEKQSEMIREVKRYNNGFINNPIAVCPNTTISDLEDIIQIHKYTGYPVTHDGTSNGKLLGMITNRDIDFVSENNSIEAYMTSLKDLYVASNNISLEEAQELLKDSKKKRLPIIDDDGNLVSLICRRDILSQKTFPDASRNPNTNQLLVGAAITTHTGYMERCDSLVSSGVDIICIDSSQGNSIYQIDTIKAIKEKYPNIDIIAGNVVTAEQAKNLIDAGADALRVGMGVGSICTTQDVTGIGRPQASAIYHVSNYTRHHISSISYGHDIGVPIIADGGISSSGNIVKALSIGASAVMLGSLLAGTDESPGEYIYHDGIRVKKYRGMGSLDALRNRMGDRYMYDSKSVKVAQGVSGEVVGKGSITRHIPYLIGGVKSGFQNLGFNSIEKIKEALYTNKLKIEIRSFCSQREGGVHHLLNYD